MKNQQTAAATHRKCTRCLDWFEATEDNFFKNGDRLRSQCKDCYMQSTADNRQKRTGKPATTRRKASTASVETSDLRQIVALLDQHQIPDADSVIRRVEIALNQRRSFGVMAIEKSRSRISEREK